MYTEGVAATLQQHYGRTDGQHKNDENEMLLVCRTATEA